MDRYNRIAWIRKGLRDDLSQELLKISDIVEDIERLGWGEGDELEGIVAKNMYLLKKSDIA